MEGYVITRKGSSVTGVILSQYKGIYFPQISLKNTCESREVWSIYFYPLYEVVIQKPPWNPVVILTGSYLLIFFFNRGKDYLFIYLFLFLAVLGLRFMRGLSPVAASGGHSSSRCAGLSLSRPLLLRSTGSRRAGSVVVAHGPSCSGSVVVAHRPSCSAACGIFPDQGSNPCPLHRQADSQPLRHQGSP